MNLILLILPPAALLLAGCQSVQKVQSSRPNAAAVIANVAQQQQKLWQEGVINQTAVLPGDPIRANSSRVSLQWDGDAVELLSRLARQRGQAFTWTGVRLPLPVSINVQEITYQNLLRMIELQTAWRATLHEYPGQLTLAFAQPAPRKPRGSTR